MAITTSGTTLTFNDATTQTTAATTSIPSGSVLLFYQAAAPTGWTQVTTLNDYDLRLVSGTGGGTGGTTAYSTVFTNQTPTFTGSIGTLSVGATTLSTAQIPSHTHTYNNPSSPTSYGCGTSGGNFTLNSSATGAEGGGGSHSHALTGTPSGTVGVVTLNVRYANIIICSKN